MNPERVDLLLKTCLAGGDDPDRIEIDAVATVFAFRRSALERHRPSIGSLLVHPGVLR